MFGKNEPKQMDIPFPAAIEHTAIYADKPLIYKKNASLQIRPENPTHKSAADAAEPVLGPFGKPRESTPLQRTRLNLAIAKLAGLFRRPTSTKEMPVSPVEAVERLIKCRNMGTLREIARLLAEVPGFSVRVKQEPTDWARRGPGLKAWERGQGQR